MSQKCTYIHQLWFTSIPNIYCYAKNTYLCEHYISEVIFHTPYCYFKQNLKSQRKKCILYPMSTDTIVSYTGNCYQDEKQLVMITLIVYQAYYLMCMKANQSTKYWCILQFSDQFCHEQQEFNFALLKKNIVIIKHKSKYSEMFVVSFFLWRYA